jgi:RIO-like serine/threonine protein kinase
MTPTREQLIEALYREYEYLCHDDFDPDEDLTPEEYLEMINTLSYEELVSETSTDETYTLEQFLSTYS